MTTYHPLLDLPPYPATGYAALADRFAALLGTSNDVLLVQGEAIIALEAAAASLARPGLRALNFVTSPYGGWFGDWLRRGGATVLDIVAEPGLPVTLAAAHAGFEAMAGVELVALVHAESASGILNPLGDIAALARSRGALLVLDAVASAGGHTLALDALGVDLCVTGPQKSFGGSSGVSVVSLSRRAWAQVEKAGALGTSILALADHRPLWLDQGRGALPGMPSALEFWALEAALDRVEAEGLARLVARHEQAAAATRAGVLALGLRQWVRPEHASNLVTAAPMPPGVSAGALVAAAEPFAAGLVTGIGTLADRLVRLNHTGPRANPDFVLAGVGALGHGLRALDQRADIEAATEAVLVTYGGTR